MPARQMHEEALALARASGRKVYEASALFGLGLVLTAEGNLAEAGKLYEDALAIDREIDRQGDVVNASLALAALAIEDHRPAEAEARIKDLAEYFRAQKDALREAYAQALLAQSLLAQGRLAEAQTAIDRALRLAAGTQHREYAMDVAIAAARVHAAGGKAGQAVASLNRLINEATRMGFLSYQFQARLALGEIELKSGHGEAGRARLKALAAEATALGFGLIARKATAL